MASAALHRSARHAAVIRFARDCVRLWKPRHCAQPDEAFTVARVTGGLSNLLYSVTAPEGDASYESLPCVLVRKMLLNEVVDANDERLVAQVMGDAGMAPRVLGLDTEQSLRCEEFFPARTLRTTDIAAAHERMLYDGAGDGDDDSDMPAHSLLQAMAYQVARVHAQRPPRLHASSPRKPILQHTMRRWMKGCRDAVSSFDSSANKALQEEYTQIASLGDIEAEVRWFLQQVADVWKPAPSQDEYEGWALPFDTVFCHNDLQPGNWMLDDSGCIKTIDFEFAGFNFRGYDIANMMVELVFDYNIPQPPFFALQPHLFPGVEYQEKFLRAYLAATHVLAHHRSAFAHLDCANKQRAALVERSMALEAEVPQSVVDRFTVELPHMVMGSHLLWTLWSVIMARANEDIDFDYLGYGAARFQAYLQGREHNTSAS